MNHPPTYVRTFLLHKVRENCHFLDHPPTPVSLRNIKMAPKVCGQLTCYLMQLAVLIPFFLGHTFVFQIAFHRNVVATANTKQNQPIIKLRQHRHKICITTLSIIYLTIVLLLIGFDGIVHQVMNDLRTVYPLIVSANTFFLNLEFVVNSKVAAIFQFF